MTKNEEDFSLYIDCKTSEQLIKLQKISQTFDNLFPIELTFKYRLWLNDRLLVERFFPVLQNEKILCEAFTLNKDAIQGKNLFKLETFKILKFNIQNIHEDQDKYFYKLDNIDLVFKKIEFNSNTYYPNETTFAFEI